MSPQMRDCIFHNFFVFIQSLFFWNISQYGPALLKGIRVLLIAFWSSFTTSQVVSVLSLFAKSPRYLCNRTPTAPAAAHPGWKFRAALANRTPRGPKPPSGHLRVHSKLPPSPSPSLFQNTWLCKLGIIKDKRDPVLYIYSDNLGKSYNNIICITQL